MHATLTPPPSLLVLARTEERSTLKTPLLAALALHLALVVLGYYSPKDNLLELINQGETLAIAPTDPTLTEKVVELDLVPPPPPEFNPEFVRPQEVRPKLEIPPPVIKPKPTPVVAQEEKPVPQLKYAASGVEIGNKDFPKPPYPYEAKLKRFQGTVIVSINVVSGVVVGTEVDGSSGYGVLDSAATSWIRQHWKFPENVTRTLNQPVRFELGS